MGKLKIAHKATPAPIVYTELKDGDEIPVSFIARKGNRIIFVADNGDRYGIIVDVPQGHELSITKKDKLVLYRTADSVGLKRITHGNATASSL